MTLPANYTSDLIVALWKLIDVVVSEYEEKLKAEQSTQQKLMKEKNAIEVRAVVGTGAGF
jgi:hypothetical protein